jgi:hypothetical protein
MTVPAAGNPAGPRSLPAKGKLTLCFAHADYRIGERFALRDAGIEWCEIRSPDELKSVIDKVDVLLCSGLWPPVWGASARG